jgi:hypothetical protein
MGIGNKDIGFGINYTENISVFTLKSDLLFSDLQKVRQLRNESPSYDFTSYSSNSISRKSLATKRITRGFSSDRHN